MQHMILIGALMLLTLAGYHLGRSRSLVASGGKVGVLHSLPRYHGYYLALWAGLPAFAVLAAWASLEPVLVKALVLHALPAEAISLGEERLELLFNEVRLVARHGQTPSSPIVADAAQHYQSLRQISFLAMAGVTASLAALGLAWGRRFIQASLRARNKVERLARWALIACSTVAIFTTVGIVLSLLYESLLFFKQIPVSEFLFGTTWSPQMAIRADQVGSSGAFGALPLFAGTALISLIAMVVAVPLGLLSAIFLAEYAQPKFRAWAKPLLEVLAGIPTVVYGFFAALTLAPAVRDMGAAIGLPIASESALVAGLVMGVMIIPFISSLSDDIITAVPNSLREGAYGLGATKSETIRQVIMPAALPGIVGGVLLAVSRAIGETMIVVMAAGLSANLTANPFEAVTTVTVQIVTLLVGDQEFDSPKTLAAFALGLVLFCVTLILNVIALHVVRKYREQYD